MPTSPTRSRPATGRRARPAATALLLVCLVLPGTAAAAPATTAAAPVTASPAPGPSSGPALAGSATTGTWRVVRSAPGTWRVSWRSPRRLPVTSDRPTIVEAGQPVGVPAVPEGVRTVVTTVVSDERPDPSSLDVVLSGDRLDQPGTDRAGEAPRPASVPRRRVLRADPTDAAGAAAFPVVSSDYELPAVKLPRMPEPIEMVGHVVEPAADAATGPRPLVLFLHGRHSYCYDPTGAGGDDWRWPCRPPLAEVPSHLGYRYLQRLLASQGFATVSVRVNGINAQDWRLADGGADARARIVERHLDHWVTLADEHQVDLSRVVLVGHSRGGEGVDRASLRIPLDAPYRVVGQVLLAPTDFGTQTAPYVPTVTVLPYCDGDVYDLQGQRFTDSARDLTADDTSLKSSVLVLGANHNFFNTEWTPRTAQAPAWDDWAGGGRVCGRRSPTRLSAREQRGVASAYVAGAARLLAEDAQEFLPLFDGSPVRPASVGDADVRSHAIGGGRDVRRPALDTGLSLAVGAESSFCLGVVSSRSPDACGRGGWDLLGNAPHWYAAAELAPPRRALELTWTAPGQTAGVVLDRPLDLTGDRLELRTVVDPTLGDVRIRLRLTDADGASAEVTPVGNGEVPALPVDRRVGKRWAQAVLADPAQAAGVDLSRVVRVDVVGDSPDGRVWVLDLAAAPEVLPAVPERRLPTVSLHSLVVPEGDDPTPRTVRLPFTVDGELSRPATLTVGVQGPETPRLTRLRVDLAPGQTEGFLRHELVGDTADGFPRLATSYLAFPVTGVMTDVYDGRVTVVDDDPPPRVRISTPRRVAEGEAVEIEARLLGERSYESWTSAVPIRGRGEGRRLTVRDLPRDWAESHGVLPGTPDLPLHRTDLAVYDRIKASAPGVVLRVPVRADGVEEGPERVTFRVFLDRTRVVRTVRVVD